MRYFFNKEDKKQGFKGSVLVVFPKEEKAKEFMELGEVKFKDTVLIRKWHTDYVEEKKKEIEERRAKKEARKKENQDDDFVEDVSRDIAYSRYFIAGRSLSYFFYILTDS